jgi:hypothetical protein
MLTHSKVQKRSSKFVLVFFARRLGGRYSGTALRRNVKVESREFIPFHLSTRLGLGNSRAYGTIVGFSAALQSTRPHLRKREGVAGWWCIMQRQKNYLEEDK